MINWTEANSIQQKTVEVKNVHRWDYLSNAAWLGLLVARPEFIVHPVFER